MKNILIKLKLLHFKRLWRKKNENNFTTVNQIFDVNKVDVGKRTYGSLNVRTYGNKKEKLVIGSYCSIAADVWFLLGGEHNYTGLLTYPFDNFINNKKENTITKGQIIISDDVWIGEGSKILSGVTVGQGAIIGAGTVVAKDIPPYSIYVNNKILKYRFDKDTINELIKLDLSNLDEDFLKENSYLIYEKLNYEQLMSVKSSLIKSTIQRRR